MTARLAALWLGGALGALANSLAVWLVARAGLLAAIGVRIAPRLEWEWLAHRLVWGSLWALGWPLVARLRLSPGATGLVLSLAPSAAQLLYFFPRSGHALFGLDLGIATPAVVLAANALWGWVLARTVVAAGQR